MILKDLALHLDKIFHKNLAYTWDKVGLQIGRSGTDIKKILITLDIDDEVIEEAVNTGSNLIISHHPLIFEPVENITGSSRGTSEKILKLIEKGIAVYTAHTNYDIMPGGLIDVLSEKLELDDLQYIKQENAQWYKFVIFVPRDSQDKVRKAICSQGGGEFKNYSCCTFNVAGKGTFLPGEGAEPYIGEKGNLNIVDEIRMECIVSEDNLEVMVKTAIEAHPYEEAAYDIYKIKNNFGGKGLGRYGKLRDPEIFKRYLKRLKQQLQVGVIGWMHKGIGNPGNKLIEKIAIINGSANSLTGEISALDCDLVLVGEIGYHNSIEISETGKIVAVLGHGTSEKWAIDDMYDHLNDFSSGNNMALEIIKSKEGYWVWRYDIG